MVSIIVAYTTDMAIGRDNGLLFHLSGDLKRFKALTTGNVIVMGRKTFESLPKGALPDRENVVVSTTRDDFPRAVAFKSLDEALARYADDAREVFVIGGGSIYRQAIGMADRIYATEILCESGGADTFFPHIDSDVWVAEEAGEVVHDERCGVDYRFVNYRRR